MKKESSLGQTPLHDADAIELLDIVMADDLNLQRPVVLAVSGGPDSMALLYFTDLWARQRKRELLVLTVDHSLRQESANEAAEVARRVIAMGHTHQVLTWHGTKPATGIQAAARDIRFTLLSEACYRAGALTMLFAHHRDDQAETLLHRINGNTGPEGLASMSLVTSRNGLRLARPFLSVPKDRLLATCTAASLDYINDPSNEDLRFARAKLRHLKPALSEIGLTVDRLTRLSSAMGIARCAMRKIVGSWLARYAVVYACGTCRLDLFSLQAGPDYFTAVVLRCVFNIVGGFGHPPSSEAMTRLIEWITGKSAVWRRTLRGCLLQIDNGSLIVMREEVACAQPVVVRAGQIACWDGRFLIRNKTNCTISVGSCGANGWRQIKCSELFLMLSKEVQNLPYPARIAWPLVTNLDGSIALPHLVSGEQDAVDSKDVGVTIFLMSLRAQSISGLKINGRLRM
ncbi:tRNA(Ile)-lysidine synthetase [Candidatus Endolissoclinum faulkneri L2]|uniref:tRNA(Ile)-lysidine synthase n=1 Tax=Candidatus Endolissoclinum faulkneri L2 TaxID=1193729 RepID=K7YQ51_9PROT|nr:tRNA lysidine(34) synthetase TilS [Candidatus Endolissoclinum faulkneri]AFX98709.1 tRNA(Ile)-lysidine synthetase [Candidatus Endolissoclinum faulkneri L2]